jgi:hypothetical protein
MPPRHVGKVNQRGTTGRTCINDFENSLEIPVQVHNRPGIPVELEGLVSFIPPAMKRAVRDEGGAPGAYRHAAPVDHNRKGASYDVSLFVLGEVRVHRGSLRVRRKRTFQFQPDFIAPFHATKRQPLAGVPVLKINGAAVTFRRRRSFRQSVPLRYVFREDVPQFFAKQAQAVV